MITLILEGRPLNGNGETVEHCELVLTGKDIEDIGFFNKMCRLLAHKMVRSVWLDVGSGSFGYEGEDNGPAAILFNGVMLDRGKMSMMGLTNDVNARVYQTEEVCIEAGTVDMPGLDADLVHLDGEPEPRFVHNHIVYRRYAININERKEAEECATSACLSGNIAIAFRYNSLYGVAVVAT